jgi:hypothetical protein
MEIVGGKMTALTLSPRFSPRGGNWNYEVIVLFLEPQHSLYIGRKMENSGKHNNFKFK